MSTYPLILQTISSLTGIATTTSLIIAYRQWRLATRNTQTAFEDTMAREYRQVANRLPLKALLGQPLNEAERDAALPQFFWYFDLTNEQAFMRRHGRISDETWVLWREGILTTLERPAFADAWSVISAANPDAFRDLRALLDDAPRTTPHNPGSSTTPPRATASSSANPSGRYEDMHAASA
jgi:hypothetical protein